MTEIHQVKSLSIIENEIIISEIQGAKLNTKRQLGNRTITTGCIDLLAQNSVHLAYALSEVNNEAFFKFEGYDYHIHVKCTEAEINTPDHGLACFLLFCSLRNMKNKFTGLNVAAMGELDLCGNVTKIPNLQTKINDAVDRIDSNIILLPRSDEKIRIKGKKVYQISNIEELFQSDKYDPFDDF